MISVYFSEYKTIYRIMLDYYGSITKQKDEIKQDILRAFCPEKKGGYNESYILRLANELGIIDQEYSVSGWMVFHYKTAVDLIKSEIQVDTDRATSRLSLARLSQEHETVRRVPLDIIELISQKIY